MTNPERLLVEKTTAELRELGLIDYDEPSDQIVTLPPLPPRVLLDIVNDNRGFGTNEVRVMAQKLEGYAITIKQAFVISSRFIYPSIHIIPFVLEIYPQLTEKNPNKIADELLDSNYKRKELITSINACYPDGAKYEKDEVVVKLSLRKRLMAPVKRYGDAILGASLAMNIFLFIVLLLSL